jgi:hypothetical protein
MSADGNVVQWLASTVMILTNSMNRPGGVWFHPGFFRQTDAAPLPMLSPEMYFGFGPPSRPELPGFLGEGPCAALPSEIAAGNIRAVLNLGGGLLTAFPDERVLRPALAQLDVLATVNIAANSTTALSTHMLPTKDQLERADINLWDFVLICSCRAFSLVAALQEGKVRKARSCNRRDAQGTKRCYCVGRPAWPSARWPRRAARRLDLPGRTVRHGRSCRSGWSRFLPAGAGVRVRPRSSACKPGLCPQPPRGLS